MHTILPELAGRMRAAAATGTPAVLTSELVLSVPTGQM
jgi:hypothetical protein